jgi:hypothetical protein
VLDNRSAGERSDNESERKHHARCGVSASIGLRRPSPEVTEEDKRDAHEPSRPETLHHAQRDQLVHRGGETAADRPEREQSEGDQQHAARSVTIGELAVEGLRDGRGQGVGHGQPWDPADGIAAEVPGDDRRGGGHDCGIQQRKKDGGDPGGDDRPDPPVRRVRRGETRGLPVGRQIGHNHHSNRSLYRVQVQMRLNLVRVNLAARVIK